MSDLSHSDAPLPEPGQPAQPARVHQPFGWKQMLALVFAVGITFGIFAFRDQIRQLEHLGYLGGFLGMLLGNATLILPVPGLIFVFVLGGTLNPLLVGLTAGPGAALGEFTGYAAGYGGSSAIDQFDVYQRIRGWMNKYGLLVIVVLAAVPNPLFDMAGVVCGSLRVPWWKFLLAAWVGKTIQALFIAYAGAFSLGWVEQFLH
ncbi:MAG: VTT domain-containing protein [Anaerolineae bacterium]|nr:VTT domain-containing protein [Anaerolineae bacterium]